MNNNQLVQFNNYLKPVAELPKYISFEQYKLLRNQKISDYYNNLKLQNKKNEFLKQRDTLMVDFMFATGGRINDIVTMTKQDINFSDKILNLRIQKSKKTIRINLDNELCYMLINFIHNYNIKDEDKIFSMTRQNAWITSKKLGKLINLNLNPHMFRHGLALYLLSQGVDLELLLIG